MPIAVVAHLAVGLAFALCARERIRVDGPFAPPAFSLVLMHAAGVVAPVALYFYAVHPAWSWMYMIDPGGVSALALAPSYVGVVASARRFAQLRETLAARGVPGEALDAIHSPAGLAIGARTPEEIALSVLAEIVAQQRAEEGTAKKEPEKEKDAAAVPAEAVDPICGMTVAVAGARHTAEHAGRTYYFCCGGCRQRFLAAPEDYVPAAGDAA